MNMVLLSTQKHWCYINTIYYYFKYIFNKHLHESLFSFQIPAKPLGLVRQTRWIRPQTLNHEVSGSDLLAAAVVPLCKALYPHCLVPLKGLKAIGPWLLPYKQLAFLVAR